MGHRGSIVVIVTLGVLAVGALGVWVAVGYFSVAGVATPEYTVVEKRDGYEVREYAPRLVAEVTVTGSRDEALNAGFRKLADFIFGNNTASVPGAPEGSAPGASSKIAMTAPVLERSEKGAQIAMTAPVLEKAPGAGAHVVSFVMPAEYTLATLPKPRNAEIRIVEVPATRYAVLSFSGRAREPKTDEMKARLAQLTGRDGLVTQGEPLLAQYDPPWTPPFMRKNEVWLEVR